MNNDTRATSGMNGSPKSSTEAGRQGGYSLVELMASMLITLFVMGGVYGLMIQNQKTYEQQSNLADVQQSVRVALDLMAREIRMAGSDPSRRAFTPDTSCMDATYATPSDVTSPAPGDVAPITIAKATQIRVKMDRPTFVLGNEATGPTPTPTLTPAPKEDCGSPGDGEYLGDDEDGLGDGFLNDEGEDIEYILEGSILYRIEYKSYPQTACSPCVGSRPGNTVSKLPIANNVVELLFNYFDQEPPDDACPTGVYATSAEYETARSDPGTGCDPRMAFGGSGQVSDLSAIQRVRIKLVIETEKVDIINPSAGRNRLTLTSEVTLRNRTF